MNNARIADAFEQVADLLEFKGANAFRVRAYRRGARTIRDLPDPVTTIIDDPNRKLVDVEGIGKDLAAKCEVLIDTGHLPLLEELLEDIPRTVIDLLRVPGLGPKKAAAVFHELGITDLAGLKEACESKQVRELKGFGEKTEQAILNGIEIANAANERILWSEADMIAQELLGHLQNHPKVEQIALAGSYRRRRETVGDLDVLVTSPAPNEVMDLFREFGDIVDVIGRGDTKMSVRLDKSFQVDLRVVPAESFGAALQYFTGSKDHNVILRGRAKKKGLKINEYGVYQVDDGTFVAGATEEEVYDALGLPVIPPELREARGEFDIDAIPQLVELSDIQGDLHMHTTESDGKASLEEMVKAAKKRGLKYIAITDHSQRVSMANGLGAKRLLQQWAMIDDFNEQHDESFIVLKGIECDILEQGGMDLPDDVLCQADWVLASVHYGQRQSRQQITERILGALENPAVTAIAHPTGRLLNRREAYDVDIDAVFKAAKENGKLLELNSHPRRLDLNDLHCAAAKQHDIPMVLNTDAHSTGGLDVMKYGVNQARRGGLTPADVANTRSWNDMKKPIHKDVRS